MFFESVQRVVFHKREEKKLTQKKTENRRLYKIVFSFKNVADIQQAEIICFSVKNYMLDKSVGLRNQRSGPKESRVTGLYIPRQIESKGCNVFLVGQSKPFTRYNAFLACNNKG